MITWFIQAGPLTNAFFRSLYEEDQISADACHYTVWVPQCVCWPHVYTIVDDGLCGRTHAREK